MKKVLYICDQCKKESTSFENWVQTSGCVAQLHKDAHNVQLVDSGQLFCCIKCLIEYLRSQYMESKMVVYAEKKNHVTCPECLEGFNEEKVNSTNIESDELGRDIVTFDCPSCKKTVKSLRYG